MCLAATNVQAKPAGRHADSRESTLSSGSRAVSMMTQISIPPAYEVVSSGNTHAGSAPPTVSQFGLSNIAYPNRGSPEFRLNSPQPQRVYEGTEAADILASYHDDERGSPPSIFRKSPRTPLIDRARLAPSPSVRTTSSGAFLRSRLSSRMLNGTRHLLSLRQLCMGLRVRGFLPIRTTGPQEYRRRAHARRSS